MAAGYTSVSAAKITDATGTPLASGSITFTPCDNNGNAISFVVNGSGQAISEPVTAQVVNGAFNIALADTSLTSPKNVCYKVSLRDNLTSQSALGPGYLIQPSGANWSFDNFVPNLAALVTVQLGPQGQGFNFRGAWAPDVTYAPYDCFTQGGNSYVVTTAYTSGSAFGATDTANAVLFAASGALSGQVTTPLTASAGATITGGLTVDTMSTGTATEQDLPANYEGALYVIRDAAGFIGFAVQNGPNGALVKIGGDLTVTGLLNILGSLVADGYAMVTSSEVELGVNPPNALYAISDPKGNVAFAVRADGRVLGTLALDPAVKGAFDGDETMFYTGTDANGLYQVFSANIRTAAIAKLTSTGNNIFVSLSEDGQTVTFASDRAGSVATLYRMDRNGVTKLTAASPFANAYEVSHVIGVGQSLMLGALAVPPLSTSQPYDSIMFNSGLRCGVDSGNASSYPAVQSANIASFTPMVEATDAFEGTYGETVMSGCFNHFVRRHAALGKTTLLGSIHAWGGHAYSAVGPGTQPYLNALASITAAKAITVAASETYGVRAIFCIHGEQDELGSGNPNYEADLVTWQSDLQSAIQAITGQTETIPMILSQISSYGIYAGHATPIIPPQQLAACDQNPGKLLCVGPKYHLPYEAGQGVHLSAIGYRWHGEEFAKVLAYVMQGKSWRPLEPRSAYMRGNSIIADFYVPVAPLQIDTVNVTEPDNFPGSKYGFEFTDGSATPPTITAINIVGPETLEIVLSGPSTGGSPKLAYAWTTPTSGTAAYAGPTSGPRGNLCDSDATPSIYGNDLRNRCVHFQIPVL
ncbi:MULTISPECIES: PD40 domain-containing protein [Acidobacterium]|uniref:Sialate O-acetylesterase domain-containing protein n=1 Tax=Acidobacterium capsulatum (strain ATCC 51196 / DSM 11244 / BCRC 80197 / JCM 7670 / NBRC 15755 / NCIMB 13165 / 161) TaxID=240015 RepID=C1F9Z1_ACIC5|nr:MULTISPECIES: PD40 domain-containing protein [Acidobacterium]ACO34278.1 hypothetical protein ACP_0367 [Acidobacterium capsulatum ATCC 51196]HCT62090.1 hypothetical protein [Acidobacterium sp.]